MYLFFFSGSLNAVDIVGPGTEIRAVSTVSILNATDLYRQL